MDPAGGGPAGHRLPARRAWAVVTGPEGLREWALAWDGGDGDAELFRPELAADPAAVFLAVRGAGGRVAAGAVATPGDGVVGISNLFDAAEGGEAAWPAVLDAADRLFPGLPVVGYEHGEELEVALRSGFEAVGPVRVWVR